MPLGYCFQVFSTTRADSYVEHQAVQRREAKSKQLPRPENAFRGQGVTVICSMAISMDILSEGSRNRASPSMILEHKLLLSIFLENHIFDSALCLLGTGRR